MVHTQVEGGREGRREGSQASLPRDIEGLPNVEGHHDLFKRGIACSFTNAVDGAFDLPRPSLNGGHEISDGHAEVIVSEGEREGGRERNVRLCL